MRIKSFHDLQTYKQNKSQKRAALLYCSESCLIVGLTRRAFSGMILPLTLCVYNAVKSPITNFNEFLNGQIREFFYEF